MKAFNILLPLFALLASGCAGLVGNGQREVTLHTEPSGATVFVNGNERGETPFSYTYDPHDGTTVNFEFRRTGHLNGTLSISPQRKNGVLFIDAMLFHIPYIVDHKSPDLYSLPRSEYRLRLFKELPSDMPRQMVPITTVDVPLGERPLLGTINGKPVYHDKDSPFRSLNYPEQLSSSVVAGVKDTWMDMKTARKGTTKGDELLQRAKLYLHPELEKLEVALTEERGRCYGTVELNVLWRFMSSSKADSLLFEERTKTVHYTSGGRKDDLVADALREASRNMVEDLTLADRIAGGYNAGLAASKGGNIQLFTPKPIPYNGRREMLTALVKGVVTISMDKGHGSGFVISNDGYIITNEHVVSGESLVKIKFEQGFTLDGQVIKTNKDFDLALVKVQATDLPALSLGADKDLMLGEEIFAIGTPLDTELGQSVSRGVLSGRREIEGRSYLQTDVSINPGNSGGPLIDENGKVVGVATMKISGKGLEGLGFGVPVSVALEMLNITMAP